MSKKSDFEDQISAIQAAIDRVKKEIIDLKARVPIGGLTTTEEDDINFLIDALESQFTED